MAKPQLVKVLLLCGATLTANPQRTDEAVKQQYLTPSEESTLLDYVLRTSERGYNRFPVPFPLVRAIEKGKTSAILPQLRKFVKQ